MRYAICEGIIENGRAVCTILQDCWKDEGRPSPLGGLAKLAGRIVTISACMALTTIVLKTLELAAGPAVDAIIKVGMYTTITGIGILFVGAVLVQLLAYEFFSALR